MSIDFANDPVWSDITPIPQDDGPNPVVPISYYPSYRVATGYFRAIVARKEFSPRVLDLTDAILQDNPAHYTVWKYRQDTLMAINHDLEEELKYIDQMAEENPKNYQIWHHRQVVIEKLNDPSREIAFINASLAGDSKNYHAWTYRQWLVKHFSLWNREIIDMNRFLDEDVFNNSAWNQRYFVYSQRPEKWVPDEIHDEVKYTLMKIAIAPNNESAWSYLKGIVVLAGQKLSDYPEIVDASEKAALELNSTFGLVALLDILTEQNDISRAKQICQVLEHQDSVRQAYWKYRAEQLP